MKREYDFREGRRGAMVKTPPGKTRITIRLDDDVLEWFREQVHAAGGGNSGSNWPWTASSSSSSTISPARPWARRWRLGA